ncbi:uncharacterized protein LOC130456975 [Monodelphis domestica]|uniref:uncharacterized protein LOC130456975 n=1 Tax=Monodelphis domestica TaxID=13616 RepID=UPI0024E24577|nr:uncharacterized protein LOC130456975 [Monodelphis domestica]
MGALLSGDEPQEFPLVVRGPILEALTLHVGGLSPSRPFSSCQSCPPSTRVPGLRAWLKAPPSRWGSPEPFWPGTAASSRHQGLLSIKDAILGGAGACLSLCTAFLLPWLASGGRARWKPEVFWSWVVGGCPEATFPKGFLGSETERPASSWRLPSPLPLRPRDFLLNPDPRLPNPASPPLQGLSVSLLGKPLQRDEELQDGARSHIVTRLRVLERAKGDNQRNSFGPFAFACGPPPTGSRASFLALPLPSFVVAPQKLTEGGPLGRGDLVESLYRSFALSPPLGLAEQEALLS